MCHFYLLTYVTPLVYSTFRNSKTNSSFIKVYDYFSENFIKYFEVSLNKNFNRTSLILIHILRHQQETIILSSSELSHVIPLSYLKIFYSSRGNKINGETLNPQ